MNLDAVIYIDPVSLFLVSALVLVLALIGIGFGVEVVKDKWRNRK